VTDGNNPLTPYYVGWDTYNDYLVEAVSNLTGEQLLFTNSPSQRPVWSLAVHIAACRAHWLTRVAAEEHLPSAPLLEWDEDGEPLFTAAQIAGGLRTSWDFIATVLDRWTTDTMEQTCTTNRGFVCSRQWIIWHLIEHDLHHGGELFYTLGAHGLHVPDL
jgi:uncharacterized damage-inducible protein DinB